MHNPPKNSPTTSPTPKRLPSPAHSAQDKAQAVLAVWTERCQPAQVCRQLGISRKTYYQWEARALQGLLEAVTQQPPGRPRQADRPKERHLERKVDQLQKELDQAQESQEIRAALNRVHQTMDAKKNATHS